MSDENDFDYSCISQYLFCHVSPGQISAIINNEIMSLGEDGNAGESSETNSSSKKLSSVLFLSNSYLALYRKKSGENLFLRLNVDLYEKLMSFAIACEDENSTRKILKIFENLLKINFLSNDSVEFNNLIKFYFDLINLLEKLQMKENFKSTEILFIVRLLITFYKTLIDISKDELSQQEMNNFNKLLSELKPNIDEFEVFLNLIFSDISDKPVQIFLQLLIEYRNFTKRKNLAKILVNTILTFSKSEKNEKFEETLVVLCCLSESNLLDLISASEEAYFILDETYFWQNIQLALFHKNSTIKKQGMYLFRKFLKLCDCYNTDCSIKIKNSVDSEEKNQLKSSIKNVEFYFEILTILEFLEEQQFHIVEPIFGKINDLWKKFAFDKKTEKSKGDWFVVIYEKAFMHESVKVIKLALSSLMIVPKNYFTDNSNVERILKIIFQAVNNINLFYVDGMAVSQQLINIFNAVNVSSDVFYYFLTKEICNCTWSPESLFFVSYALVRIKHHGLKEKEICELTKFVSKAFETYHKNIKLAIQSNFLQFVINQTNIAYVPFAKIVLLLSKLSIYELFPENIEKIKNWLITDFSKEAEMMMNQLENDELPKEFNAESIGFMCFFFYYTFGSGNSDSSLNDCFVSKYLIKLFSNFENLNKRLYLNEVSCYQNLLKVYHIIKETFTNHCNHVKLDTTKLVKFIMAHLKPVKKFILAQIKLCTILKEFDICQLMIKIIKWISKMELSFVSENEFIFEIIVNFLSQHLKLNQEMPYMQIYCGMRILEVQIENEICLSSLGSNEGFLWYLEKNLNVPLQKKEEEVFSRDIQILWGRLNSKFLKAKWTLFEKFVTKNELFELNEVSAKKVAALCFNGIDFGRSEVLSPVMIVMKKFICLLKDHEKTESLINFIWSVINERRKSKKFRVFVKLFIEMIFQKEFLTQGPEYENILIRFSDLLFEDSSIAVANILMKHVYLENFSKSTGLFTKLFSKGLTYGNVVRKDIKLVSQIFSIIESEKICPISELMTSSQVRARAIVGILSTPNFDNEALETILIKMYTEVNKNNNRYFGNSFVHKVKLRVMQALLVMESRFRSKEVRDFIWDCIENENSQPSVMYMQQWYLIRWYLIQTGSFYETAVICNKLKNCLAKPKTICSLISIYYHILLKNPQLIEREIENLMPFCMDQHFEVRLYSQVLLLKLFKSRNMIKENQLISKSIERESRGNALKVIRKLENNFFFKNFEPRINYSLETIFVNLPRLTNVESEEWIPTKVFENIEGINKIQIKIVDDSLRNLDSEPWLSEKFHDELPQNVDELDELYVNYQKKIVPDSDRYFFTDSRNNVTNSKGNLIVVASLIDRLPNLGGLARTCEIFGVSELVINSLKHLQSKEFTSLSVTAEKWINIKEVKVQNLRNYLITMKESGYKIIGAEQATQSQSLSCVKFPKQSLLLLGNEKKGIPPKLLPFLDICVEIPQIGIIRSLNVHVSGALFIWEYAKQNLFTS